MPNVDAKPINTNRNQQPSDAPYLNQSATNSTTKASNDDHNSRKYTFRETDFRLRKIKHQEKKPDDSVRKKASSKSLLSKSLTSVSHSSRVSKLTSLTPSLPASKKRTQSRANEDVFEFTGESDYENMDVFAAGCKKSVRQKHSLPADETAKTPRALSQPNRKSLAMSVPLTNRNRQRNFLDLDEERASKKRSAKRLLLKKAKRSNSHGASSSDTVSSSCFNEESTSSNGSAAENGVVECHLDQPQVTRQSGLLGSMSNSVASSMCTDDDNSMEKTVFNDEASRLKSELKDDGQKSVPAEFY